MKAGNLSSIQDFPPVAFAKLRLQEADAVSGTSIFLLQTVESINDCKTKVTTSQLVEPTNGWITGAKKKKETLTAEGKLLSTFADVEMLP